MCEVEVGGITRANVRDALVALRRFSEAIAPDYVLGFRPPERGPDGKRRVYAGSPS